MNPHHFIILTREEADQVDGPTSPGYALECIPLGGAYEGKWGLQADLLNDPAHAMHHAFLASLPTAMLTWPDDFVVPDPDEDE